MSRSRDSQSAGEDAVIPVAESGALCIVQGKIINQTSGLTGVPHGNEKIRHERDGAAGRAVVAAVFLPYKLNTDIPHEHAGEPRNDREQVDFRKYPNSCCLPFFNAIIVSNVLVCALHD